MPLSNTFGPRMSFRIFNWLSSTPLAIACFKPTKVRVSQHTSSSSPVHQRPQRTAIFLQLRIPVPTWSVGVMPLPQRPWRLSAPMEKSPVPCSPASSMKPSPMNSMTEVSPGVITLRTPLPYGRHQMLFSIYADRGPKMGKRRVQAKPGRT